MNLLNFNKRIEFIHFFFVVFSKTGTVNCTGQSILIGCTVQSKMAYHIKFVHFYVYFYTSQHYHSRAHIASPAHYFASFFLSSFTLAFCQVRLISIECAHFSFSLKKLVFSIEILPHIFVHDECAERMNTDKKNKLKNFSMELKVNQKFQKDRMF